MLAAGPVQNPELQDVPTVLFPVTDRGCRDRRHGGANDRVVELCYMQDSLKRPSRSIRLSS
jgi:hypothetical protein